MRLAILLVLLALSAAVGLLAYEAVEIRRSLAALASHVGAVDLALGEHERDAALAARAWASRCAWEMVPSRLSGRIKDTMAIACPRLETCRVEWAMGEANP